MKKTISSPGGKKKPFKPDVLAAAGERVRCFQGRGYIHQTGLSVFDSQSDQMRTALL